MQIHYRRFLGVTMGLALVGMMSSVAWADRGPGCRVGGQAVGMAGHGIHGHGGATSHLLRYLFRHQKDLDLTDEQVSKLNSLALDRDRAKIRANADVQVAERELRALVRDEKSDLSAIETKVKEREAFEATLRFIGIKAKRDLLAVLTPEQREKLRVMYDRMRQSHHGRNFSYLGAEEADQGKMAGGGTPEGGIGLHEPNESLAAG